MGSRAIAIFGAGLLGREAAKYYKIKKIPIICFIDNDSKKQGKVIDEISVLSLETFIAQEHDARICIAGNMKYSKEIEEQLLNDGIGDYFFYDKALYLEHERIISYCSKEEMEDIILYHLLKDKQEIFYIDVGSNDPTIGSVTKLLYDRLGAHGINIEPLPPMIAQTKRERKRDVNLCKGVGSCGGVSRLYVQGGLSCVRKENVVSDKTEKIEIPIDTLKNICEQYVPVGTRITFLKIDVEGMEKEVLISADLEHYRPEIIVIESTLPGTNIPCYAEWEDILISNGYQFVYMRGVNRFYLAEESYNQYSDKLLELEHLENYYLIERMRREFIS